MSRRKRVMARCIITLFIIMGSFLLIPKAGYCQPVRECAFGVTSTMTPPPILNNCTVYTGDSVELCFNVGGFFQNGSNWIHGFIFDIGSGWDAKSLRIKQPPYSCSGNGYWAMYDSVRSGATNVKFGKGLYYDMNTTWDPADQNPGNNFGDENLGFCTWTFCLVIKVNSVPSPDMHFNIQITNDGLTGGWSTPSSCTLGYYYGDDSCKNNLKSEFKCNMSINTRVTQPGCLPNTGAIEVTPTGGFGNVTYKWSNAATTSSLSGLAAGTYIVTVSDDHNCTKISTHELKTNDSTRFDLVIDKGISCFGKCDAIIGAKNVSGTAPFNYKWSNNATTAGLTNICTGQYAITVTDAHQCSYTASTVLLAPPTMDVSFTTTPTRCFGAADGTVTVDVSSPGTVRSYTWTNNVTDTTSNVALNLPAGTYAVTITEFNGCKVVDSTVVTQPDKIKVTLAPQNVKCFGGSTGAIQATLTNGNPPFNFAWSTQETGNSNGNMSIQNLSAGSYSLTVTDDIGCIIDTGITLRQPQALRIDFTTTPASCDEASDGVVIAEIYGGTSPYKYFWSTKSNEPSISQLEPGTYLLTVTDANSCSGSNSTNLVAFPRFEVEGGPDREVVKGYPVEITAGVTAPGSYIYEWIPGGNQGSSTLGNLLVSPTITTTYTITVQDQQSGCRSSDEVVVTVLPNPYIFIPNTFSPNGDAHNETVFPLLGDGVTIEKFEIFNRWGERMYSSSGIDDTGWNGTYKGVPQGIGIYSFYCTYKTPEGEESRRNGTILLLR